MTHSPNAQPTETPQRAQALADPGEGYEALFVPALFRDWAPRTLAASRARPGDRLLDIACGTGIVAREALDVVGKSGSVAGVDPNHGMLAAASRLGPAVEWREGVAESLPFPDGSFDVVVSQFGFMFFDDRVEAVREMIRVLSPGGRIAVVVWDDIKKSPPYAVLAALLENKVSRRAAYAVYAPFVLGDRQDLVKPFIAAGISSVEVTTQVGQAKFPSLRTLVEAELRSWLPAMGVYLEEYQIRNVLEEAETALSHFARAEGNVAFDMSAHIATAARP